MKAPIGYLLLLMVLWTGGAVAQAQVFSAAVDAVQVDVAVTSGGRPVANLVAENFVVTDNGARQEATVVMRADPPLRVVLAIDTSQSVKGSRLRQLTDACIDLTSRLRNRDQVSIVTFSDRAQLRIPMGPPGSHVGEGLKDIPAAGATSLFDALSLAFALEANERMRSLIVLFSDGQDNASWMPVESVMQVARRASSVLHVVRFVPNEALDDIAAATGGRTFSADSNGNMRELFTRAIDEMRSRYVLTYVLTGEQKKGWHDISVRLRNARGDISARRGYFVP